MKIRDIHATVSEPIPLEEIARIIDEAEVVCSHCGNIIRGASIGNYDHDGGIPVRGYSKAQWVYFTCDGCGHQWSLTKLLNKIDRMYKETMR